MPSSPHIQHSASLSQLQDFICAVDGVIEDSPDTTVAAAKRAMFVEMGFKAQTITVGK
jgi:hypothetical protein